MYARVWICLFWRGRGISIFVHQFPIRRGLAENYGVDYAEQARVRTGLSDESGEILNTYLCFIECARFVACVYIFLLLIMWDYMAVVRKDYKISDVRREESYCFYNYNQ